MPGRGQQVAITLRVVTFALAQIQPIEGWIARCSLGRHAQIEGPQQLTITDPPHSEFAISGKGQLIIRGLQLTGIIDMHRQQVGRLVTITPTAAQIDQFLAVDVIEQRVANLVIEIKPPAQLLIELAGQRQRHASQGVLCHIQHVPAITQQTTQLATTQQVGHILRGMAADHLQLEPRRISQTRCRLQDRRILADHQWLT